VGPQKDKGGKEYEGKLMKRREREEDKKRREKASPRDCPS